MGGLAMRKEDFKDWTSDRLIDKIINLTEKNFNLEWRIKQFEETEGRWKRENQSIQGENQALKRRIKDLEDVCDGSCFSEKEDDRDKLIADLQDQHQQDCIRINDLTTTVHVLAGLYSALRKNVGMD